MTQFIMFCAHACKFVLWTRDADERPHQSADNCQIEVFHSITEVLLMQENAKECKRKHTFVDDLKRKVIFGS